MLHANHVPLRTFHLKSCSYAVSNLATCAFRQVSDVMQHDTSAKKGDRLVRNHLLVCCLNRLHLDRTSVRDRYRDGFHAPQ